MNIVITGGGATDLIEWRPDPAIMKIVATWPVDIESARAAWACRPMRASKPSSANTFAKTLMPSSCRCPHNSKLYDNFPGIRSEQQATPFATQET